MFAALHIPEFPMAAVLRTQPEWIDSPCVMLSPATGRRPIQEKLPLLAVNPAAQHTGIRSGWPLNRALIRCPNLRIVSRDVEAELALQSELLAWAETLTPDVELTAADVVTLDLGSLRTPFKDDDREKFSLAGVELGFAQAATPDLAQLAARQRSISVGRTPVPGVASLPLGVLKFFSVGQDVLRLLKLWGLRTLGDLMKLPRQGLAERLGKEAAHWHDVLHGKFCRLLRLHRPPQSLAQRLDFEEAIEVLDPLIFALKRLLHTLAARLASRNLAAGLLEFRLLLESGDTIERRIRLPDPQTAVEGMLSPLQTWLESLRLEAAVVALALDAEATFATSAQREWFGRQLPQPERWAETLAQLEALLGSGRVGIPVIADTHAPDPFMLELAMSPSAVPASLDGFPAASIPLHRYRPPRLVAVAHELRDRQPWPLALLNGPHPGPIQQWRGPFPASGAWWEVSGTWQRLEWDIQLTSRHLLRLVFQPPEHWHLEGIYG